METPAKKAESKSLFTKTELIEKKEFRFESEGNILEIWHDSTGPNWSNPFKGFFNGEFFSLKTFEAFERKVNLLIENHELEISEDEDNDEVV